MQKTESTWQACALPAAPTLSSCCPEDCRDCEETLPSWGSCRQSGALGKPRSLPACRCCCFCCASSCSVSMFHKRGTEAEVRQGLCCTRGAACRGPDCCSDGMQRPLLQSDAKAVSRGSNSRQLKAGSSLLCVSQQQECSLIWRAGMRTRKMAQFLYGIWNLPPNGQT